MGRIKTAMIKRISEEIYEKYKEKVSKDYEQNKLLVESLISNNSKKLRNTIAGYVTRLAKKGEI
ncbi:MAG: 30S ribosomal protein S17e [Candidatus Woesearchaeota archaeon]